MTEEKTIDAAFSLKTLEPGEQQIAELGQKYLAIRVKGVEDMEGYTAAHEALMVMVKMRTGLEKERLSLTEEARKYVAEINSAAKRRLEQMAPIEEHLRRERDIVLEHRKKLEAEAAARKEAERKAKLDDRLSRLDPLLRDLNRRAWPASEVENYEDAAFDEAIHGLTVELQQKRKDDERREAEQKKRDAELAYLREQEEKRIAAEREKIAAENKRQAEERARLAAERRKLEEEAEERTRFEAAKRREEQAKLDAERAELAAEKKRLADLEQKRIDEERRQAQAAEAKRLAEEEAERRRQVELANEERKAGIAALRPLVKRAVNAVEKVQVAVAQYDDSEIPDKHSELWFGELRAECDDILQGCIDKLEKLIQ